MADKKDEKKPAIAVAGFKEEVAEEYYSANYGAYVKTGFPEPARRFRLVYESQQASIEYTYFWMYNHLLQDMGFGNIVKTVDTFGASENSSFWGVTQQRQSIQQDRASQYLATIGKMIKELFQIVREIRILKERLKLYEGSAAGKQADDIALKGYWVDMVEGGTRQQANIYVIAQQLGFGTLPDLFYSIFVKKDDDVAKVVDDRAKEFNEKVREVLKRKLAQYLAWKQETHKEHIARTRFTLKYLRQHWAIIKMYMSWVKPYLRNVQKLQAPDKYDRNPELISSFEGALMEIEFIARRAGEDLKDENGNKVLDKDGNTIQVYPTILATFNYRAKPQMQFQAEGYQRGPVHVGRVEFTLRSYGWTQAAVDDYMKYREQETLEMLSVVDQSVRDAMDALGDDLYHYLKEAGEEANLPLFEEKKDDKKPPSTPMNFFEPFTALYQGFKEIVFMPFGSPVNADNSGNKNHKIHKGTAKTASAMAYNAYKNYKSAHGMPKW